MAVQETSAATMAVQEMTEATTEVHEMTEKVQGTPREFADNLNSSTSTVLPMALLHHPELLEVESDRSTGMGRHRQ